MGGPNQNPTPNNFYEGANAQPQVSGTAAADATLNPPGATPDNKSLFGPTVKAALGGLFKGLSNPQQSSMPGAAPVQQTPINTNFSFQAPNSEGNYPHTSLARRGQFAR